MFYEPQAGHGLPHDPFKAIVAPRPIGWISTVNEEGQPNLAPYSFFNALSSHPPMVGFSSEGMKDTPRNARITREFVFNLATLPLARAMNDSAATLPHGESEFEFAGLDFIPSDSVRPPRVAGSPAALECRVVDCIELHDLEGRALDRHLIVGQVVGVHIDDAFLCEGRFDTAAAQALARCGYRDYVAVREVFELLRPGE
ncbi:flavin reductase family protein [Billgrantia endophytica]|uniref:Asp/Glu/hydantoin racemase n=1 Tax=Billgrantia endophytica TaxID=2033802 RepID=A0A2N7TXU4_9GAMM|nr:flavin reductase family protein [Halomonas endophytica]PMR72975.1 Asp/Glu/hydantoin racemase [Halomonas endophytica]